MFSRTAKLLSALTILTLTGMSLSAAERPDPARTFAKDFAPVLTKITINDKVFFEDGKKQTEQLTFSADKPAVIKYFFTNTGSAASTISGKIFIHFINQKGKYLMGGDFYPNPPTTKWDKDFTKVFSRTVNMKKCKGQNVKLFVGIYFPKGSGARLVMKNTRKDKRIYAGTFKVE